MTENRFSYTFVMIKPDVFEYGSVGLLIDDLYKDGFEIVGGRVRKLSKNVAADFYQEHEGKDHFPRLVEFMSSGRVMGLVLKKTDGRCHDAIADMRKRIGDSDPKKANMFSYRGTYGDELPRNAIHASDSQDAFFREINLFFGLHLDSRSKMLTYFSEGPSYG